MLKTRKHASICRDALLPSLWFKDQERSINLKDFTGERSRKKISGFKKILKFLDHLSISLKDKSAAQEGKIMQTLN